MIQLENGVVTEYDASRKTYVVSLTRHGDVLARRILTGVDKPYPRFSRVVCLRHSGQEWAIIGEIDMPQPSAGDARPKTVDETAAELDSLVRTLRLASSAGDIPNFRPAGEELQFAGDASIENRTNDPRSRSRVKVFSFGSVISFASNLCFTLWDKRSSQIVTRCRNLIFSAMGFSTSITTRSDDPRTTRRELLQGNPLPSQQGTENPAPPRDDRELIEGYIPAPGGQRASGFEDLMTRPKAEYGCRTRFDTHRVEEIDNEAQTKRVRQDRVTYDDQGREMSRVTEMAHAEGNLEGDTEDMARGSYSRYGDWLELRIDSETEEATLVHLRGDANQITIAADRTEITRGEQYIKLTDDGLAISARNVTIQAERTIEETAGQSHITSAPRVDHRS